VLTSQNGFTGNPRVFALHVPISFQRQHPGARFFWRDPDGTAHPLPVYGTAGRPEKIAISN
jgi:hypothetical protein